MTAVAAVLAALLQAAGRLPDDFAVGGGGLGVLTSVDETTILIALAAGVAAMLAFQTGTSTAVSVAISVTTIPAAAYLGVASGLADGGRALGRSPSWRSTC